MATYTIAGTFLTSIGPTSGALVDVWKLTRCAGGVLPAMNAASPTGSPDAGPVTSGPTFGGPGSWLVAAPTPEQYAVRAVYNGNTYWSLANTLVEVDGVAGEIQTKAGTVLEDGSGNATVSGQLDVNGNLNLHLGLNNAGSGIYLNYSSTGATKVYTCDGLHNVRNILDDGSGNTIIFGSYSLGSGTAGSFIAVGRNAAISSVLYSSVTGDVANRYVLTADGQTYWGPGNVGSDTRLYRSGASDLTIDNGAGATASLTVIGVVTENGTATKAITSGALPTKIFTSGTAAQVLTTRDVSVMVPCTGGASASTLVVALSPDNVTFSTLVTVALPASSTGTTLPVTIPVPAGWWVKLTNTNGTIGTATYY